jgi:hypothetical protein
VREVTAEELDRAVRDPSVLPEKADQGERDGRLAAAGLPDDRERLAAAEVEADVLNRRDVAHPRLEGDREVADPGDQVGRGLELLRALDDAHR